MHTEQDGRLTLLNCPCPQVSGHGCGALWKKSEELRDQCLGTWQLGLL